MTNYWIFVSVLVTSCLFLESACRPTENELVEYFPFYGGGKGQYLEITKDQAGSVIKERIVSEQSISNDHVIKVLDENLISKVLAANLRNIQSLSSSLLRLHNIGRRTGDLGRNEKTQFRNQLRSLAESSSDFIKLAEEIGEDIDSLFKKNGTLKQNYGDDNVGEEGVGIDTPSDIDGLGEVLSGATIAEAKPVGLAVIGENGLAASRPIATAVAVSGVAIARPIATAIAGVDPSSLGLNLHVQQNKRT